MPFRLLAAGLLVLGLAACDDQSGRTNAGSFDRVALLERYRSDLIAPAYDRLAEHTDALQRATDRLATDPTPERLADARTALRQARLAWQDASLFDFGPAEGVALRSGLNTYPADTTRIRANIASGSYALGSIADRAAGGFPALDVLLHSGSDADVLAALQSDPDRRAYLRDNAAFVASAVRAVAEAWRGDYGDTFSDASNAGVDVGSSLGMLVNAYVRYYERVTRDGKIGIPAGVRSAGVARPGLVEAPYAGYSAQLAAANLRAAQRLFGGTALDGDEGVGLNDYLAALGASDLAGEIERAFAEAIAAVEALPDPLDKTIADDPAPAVAAFREMQDVVVLLKADMTSVLGITVTFQDNDGD
jgi:predicted lipoprotein